MKRELLIAVGCGIAGAAAGVGALLFLHPIPKPGPPKVQTDTLWMEAQRPQLVKPTIGQRLTTTRVRGQTAIADAPSAPAQLSVRQYCAPTIALQTSAQRPDSASSTENPPPVLPDFRGRRAGPRLELYSTLNNARRWQWTGTARGRVQWESSGDSVLVRGDRFWVRVVRGAPRCAAYGAGGAAIGGLAGQDLQQITITALVAALACAF